MAAGGDALLNERNCLGRTPFMHAATSVRPRMVAVLMAAGASHTLRRTYVCKHAALIIISGVGQARAHSSRPIEVTEARIGCVHRLLLQGVAYQALCWRWPSRRRMVVWCSLVDQAVRLSEVCSGFRICGARGTTRKGERCCVPCSDCFLLVRCGAHW